jgi:hypothetical protein
MGGLLRSHSNISMLSCHMKQLTMRRAKSKCAVRPPLTYLCRHLSNPFEDLAWQHRFSLQCLSIVYEQALCAKAPSYKTILLLDKKVRDFYVPPSLLLPGFGSGPISGEVEQPTMQRMIERYSVFAQKEMSTLSECSFLSACISYISDLQLYFISIEVILRKPLNNVLTTPSSVNTLLPYWLFIILLVPLLGWLRAAMPIFPLPL